VTPWFSTLCVVLGASENVIVAGNVFPVPPDTMTTLLLDGSAVYEHGRPEAVIVKPPIPPLAGIRTGLGENVNWQGSPA
jgi:hypothetical protein